MRIQTIAAAICCSIAFVAPAIAGGHGGSRVEGQNTNVSDVLSFLDIHSWKLRVSGPVRGVTVRVVQYVRGAHGQFQQKSEFTNFGFNYSPKMRSLPAAHVYAMLREDGNEDIFGVGIQESSSQNIRFPRTVLAGYLKIGNGQGGDGLKIGSEHILMAKYFNPNVSTDKKKDMSAYVALLVSVQR